MKIFQLPPLSIHIYTVSWLRHQINSDGLLQNEKQLSILVLQISEQLLPEEISTAAIKQGFLSGAVVIYWKNSHFLLLRSFFLSKYLFLFTFQVSLSFCYLASVAGAVNCLRVYYRTSQMIPLRKRAYITSPSFC